MGPLGGLTKSNIKYLGAIREQLLITTLHSPVLKKVGCHWVKIAHNVSSGSQKQLSTIPP